MDSDKLTTAQARLLYKALFPHANYLFRLKRRMEQTGFPPGDPLYKLACDAYDALRTLRIEVHYLSCQSGVGRPPRE